MDVIKEGPYLWTVVHGSTECSRTTPEGRKRHVQLPITITTPVAGAVDSRVPPPPYPVCALLNGFQARVSQYSHLARRLASWGFLVVQYQAPALTIIPDNQELPFLGQVLDWVQQRTNGGTSHPQLEGRADWDSLVVAGHSRGGKLAALHYVNDPRFKAAFLIDPVNNTSMTPDSEAYPNAARALQLAQKPFGLAAAGIISGGNPEGANWKVFEAASAPGSWLLRVANAGHTSFMEPQAAWERWLLDKCFGGGPASREVVLGLTGAAMVAWFRQQLAGAAPSATASAGGPGQQVLKPPPLVGSVGLAAAAHAVGALTPAAAAAAPSGVESQASFGASLKYSFLQWVGGKGMSGHLDGTEFTFAIKE